MDRRHFTRTLFAASASAGAATLAIAPAGTQAAEPVSAPAAPAPGVDTRSTAPASPGLRPLFFPEDASFWYETLRSFGHIAYGGADFGEVAATAQRITAGDYESWTTQWLATADRVAAEARRSADAGHATSAFDGYLRASNYYRSAEFFLHGRPADPRIDALYRRSVACFRAAAGLGDGRIRPVRIPYAGTTLPGYFYRGRGTAGTRPLVVMHNGFDGSAEEMHYVAAAALAERGFHVLSFDGPGQPGPMHLEGLVLRPDWERVVGPVLDFAERLPGVDRRRIALLGNSMGGELAPRAAAFEPRLRALVALDGVYDMAAPVLAMFGGRREAARQVLGAPSAPEVDAALASAAARDPQSRWAFAHGAWVTGAGSARGYLHALLDYHLGDGVAERIACPTLVCAGRSDQFFQGQPEALYEHLRCAKTFMDFEDELGAGAHCQAGAQRLAMARIGDWLDDALGMPRGR